MASRLQQGVQARGGKGSGDDRLFRIPEHEQQTVPVADFLRNVVAHHGRGLRGKLRQHFGDLHQPHKIGRQGGTRLLRFRIENVQARRAGIEVDIVAAIAHGRLATAVVEAKSARREIEQAARQSFGDVCHAVFHGDARAAQEIDDIGSDPNARVFDELEGFAENTFDERIVEQLEFRSHTGSTTALWVLSCISSRASATALMASLA